MITHEHADNVLADAIWWLRGFQSARAEPNPFGVEDPTHNMSEKLLAARNWIKSLACGASRVIGLNDRERGVALKEAEFEHLFDGLREGATEADRAMGRETAQKVFHQFHEELRILPDDQVAF